MATEQTRGYLRSHFPHKDRRTSVLKQEKSLELEDFSEIK